tara:strand:+ start:605 stop:745 length:141 start_codon:yes stop_codon:yes gene_type:complete
MEIPVSDREKEACPEIDRENDFIKYCLPDVCFEKIVEKMTRRVLVI